MPSTFSLRALRRPAEPSEAAAAGGLEADRLRAAMGMFAAGMTVITTRDSQGRPFGTTASAVSSVSLRPPLVLACLRDESKTLAALFERRRFAINILHSSQTELSDRFARRSAADTWEAVAHRNSNDMPLLEGAIATLQCELHDITDGGDHTVVVGHVVEVEQAEPAGTQPRPLYAGSYRSLGASRWRLSELDVSRPTINSRPRRT